MIVKKKGRREYAGTGEAKRPMFLVRRTSSLLTFATLVMSNNDRKL
jgi:hypothetical protein